MAFGFEFVNGFHDTANAVATVIYTNTLRPNVAVVWSGIWNLIGVLISSGAVAYGIVALLPVELVLHVGTGAGFAMVFSLLAAAIIWNAGTWYFGIPASSSHTLVGAIVGVGLMNSLLSPGHVFGDVVNWAKVQDTFAALLISPVIGFVASALVLVVSKFLIRRPELYTAPVGDKPPPLWIRALLVFTCTGVSFAHGSNDGQKGMGLIMLILIGLIPASFALNNDIGAAEFAKIKAANAAVQPTLVQHAKYTGAAPSDREQALSDFLKVGGTVTDDVYASLADENAELGRLLAGAKSYADVPVDARTKVRTDVYLVGESIGKLSAKKAFAGNRCGRGGRAGIL